MSKIVVNSWNEFDPLKHVIVGRADHTCIPPSEPATEAKVPEDSDMRGMWGPGSAHPGFYHCQSIRLHAPQRCSADYR